MTGAFEWQTTPEEAFGALFDAYERQLYQMVLAICYRRAPEIENWMRDNAPWQDQTGNARQTLYTQVIPTLGEIVVLLSHGMDYGIYLELKNAGKHAIIAPAIDHWLPIIMADIQRAL